MSRSINRSFVVGACVAAMAASPSLARDKSKPSAPLGNPGSWFTDDDYPAAAKRANEQGRVSVEIAIDETGKATGCTVKETSGSAALDKQTCDLVLRRGRFTPQLDKKGKAVASTYRISPRWVLKEDFVPLLTAPWRAAGVLKIDSAGKVLSCSEEASGEVQAWMRYTCTPTRYPPPDALLWARGGAAAESVEVTFEQAWNFDGGPQPKMAYEAPGRTVVGLLFMHFDVDTDGNVQNCKTIVANGRSSNADPCSAIPQRFGHQDVAHGVTIKNAVSRVGAE